MKSVRGRPVLPATDNGMVAFDVRLNGEKLCHAGVGPEGVLSAIVSWVRRREARPELPKEELNLSVGGLYTDQQNQSQVFPEWVRRRLSPGDRITIEIRRAASVDTPKTQRVESVEDRARSVNRYLDHVAPKHGWVKRSAGKRTGARKAPKKGG